MYIPTAFSRLLVLLLLLPALLSQFAKGAETRLFALRSIRMYGNQHIPPPQILRLLGITLPTQNELKQNTDFASVLTPSVFRTYFPYGVLGKNRVFLDSVSLQSRRETIKTMYQRKGYFDANILLSIEIDSSEEADLIIHCNEGQPYTIDSLFCSQPQFSFSTPWLTLQEKFAEARFSHFDEDSINQVLNSSVQKLHDIGYALFEYKIADVLIDSSSKSVAIILSLSNPERLRIGTVGFDHISDSSLRIRDPLLTQFIGLKPGNWLSPTALSKSKNALLGLSFFDEVNVLQNPIYTDNDTSSQILFRLRYKKNRELAFSLFLNRTSNDNFLNMGAEASYSNLLTSSSGISYSFYSRLLAQDISNTLFSTQRGLEFEYSLGASLNQPFAFFINDQRIPLTYSAQISLRNLPSNLKLLVPYIRIANFNTFPEWTLFSALTFDLTIDFTRLINFISLPSDTNQAYYRLIAPYLSLRDYYVNAPFRPASFTFGLTLTGDRRNSIITPTSGYLLTLPQIEYAPDIGYSHFLRIFSQFNTFTRFGSQSVFATKLKAGHIFNYGFRSSDNSTPPFEKHFFCGGANSVRAWPSRELRDAQSSISDSLATLVSELSAIIGSASLLEGSFEFRYTLPRPSTLDDFWADKIARSGFVLFFDWGNSFNRLTPATYEKADFARIFSPANWGYGYGLGFRFDTPAGPFRIDVALPLYDPNRSSFLSPDFSSAQYHIGLGHAF